jgi:GNAT superfamily N-acetyltransferase
LVDPELNGADVPSELFIREAHASEAYLVSEILREAASWLEECRMPLWRQEDLAADVLAPDVAAGLYVLAFDADLVVGTARLTLEDPVFWPDAVSGEAAYVHRLAVRRDYAGGAVSKALVDWAGAHALSLGRRLLRLDCDANRPGLRSLYERLGFSLHSERAVGPYLVARCQRPAELVTSADGLRPSPAFRRGS